MSNAMQSVHLCLHGGHSCRQIVHISSLKITMVINGWGSILGLFLIYYIAKHASLSFAIALGIYIYINRHLGVLDRKHYRQGPVSLATIG